MSGAAVSNAFYRAIILELERKRLAMGVSMDALSELMGVAERSYAKMVHPDTVSGRLATWDKLQKAIDVLFADGFEVIVRAGATATTTGPGTKRMIRHAAAHYDRRTQRELMRENGLKGAAAYVKNVPVNKRKRYAKAARRVGIQKLTPERRSEIAKAAAHKRWIEQRAKQIKVALVGG
jgi:hypothetical protein